MANVDLQEIMQQLLQGKKHLFVWILSISASFLTEDQDGIQVKGKAASKEYEVGKWG